jgi:hypothetical protein
MTNPGRFMFNFAGHGRCRKVLFAAVASCTTALFLWAGVGLFLYVAPVTNTPRYADALLVLAPTKGRMGYAERLMDQGYASTLAISVPLPEDGNTDYAPCAEKRAYRIVCFQPDPVTTQGEARALQYLAGEYGWQSVDVITDHSHFTRARILLSRCYKGDLRMVPFRKALPILPFANSSESWAFVYTYETAAFVKVAFNQEC